MLPSKHQYRDNNECVNTITNRIKYFKYFVTAKNQLAVIDLWLTTDG